MTLLELKARIAELGIPDNFVSLDDGLWEGRLCLLNRTSHWEVLYLERGNELAKSIFSLECDACCELLRRLMSDGSIRDHMERVVGKPLPPM